jgi:hypothetical protein
MLTESRRRSSKSSGGSRRLGDRFVEDGGDMRHVMGYMYGVRYSWWLLVFLNVYRKNPEVYGITIVALTRKYSGLSYFHREPRYFF